VHECPVKIQTPILAQMINGGVNLRRFVCPPKDVGSFLQSILSLTAKLETLHSLNLAHMDIKLQNVVTKKVKDIYLTRFIDVGFVKHLDTYNIDEPFLNFGNDYMIWPFETRFLIKDITTINFTKSEAPIVNLLKHFAYSTHTSFTKQYMPLINYFPNNQFVLLDPTATTYSDMFKMNINYLLRVYDEKKDKQDVIREIGKLTDIYSFGLLLFEVYCRIANQKIDVNLKVSPIRPITNEKENAVHVELFNTVTLEFVNFILRIITPHIESRERNLANIRAQLAPFFFKITEIYAKYYP
jgi:serine/threonine protein kinase